MIKEKKNIGFDLGAESGRCVVSIFANEKVTLHEVHRFNTHRVKIEKGFHWNILEIYNEILQGLMNAQKSFGYHFDGIGIDTWGVDYVLLDKEDRVIGFPYHYRDDRTDNIMEEAYKVVSKSNIYNKVGIQSAQFNTLFQLFAEKKQKSNFLNIADKMLLIPDYLNFLISGNKKAEYTIASTTSLVNPKTRDWYWELIDAYGFPRKIFPEIIEPGTFLGNLLPSVAEEVGLCNDIPVFAISGHDTASAVVSVPASGSNWAFLSSGTWSLMGLELNNPMINNDSMHLNFTNEGGIEKTIRFIKNIIGLWPLQESIRYWFEKSQEYSYAQLTKLAKENGFSGSWIDLDDSRFFKVGMMPEKILSYLDETGQTLNSGAGFITQVILESLVFSYRKTIKEIENITGRRIKNLYAIGGGIQNEYLMQLTADAIGRTVIAGPVEGTIVGNIGVQLMASGIVSNLKTWRKIVDASFDLKVYEPVDTEYFDVNEKEFDRICNPVWK